MTSSPRSSPPKDHITHHRPFPKKSTLDPDLLRSTLGALLGDLGSCTSVGDGSLCLVGLALVLPLLLVLLALGKSLCLSSGSHLWLLVPACGNGVQRGTDDTSLVLDGSARALLGSLLGDTLLVHATAEDGPGDLAWVLSLQEEGLALGGDESERLCVRENCIRVSD